MRTAGGRRRGRARRIPSGRPRTACRTQSAPPPALSQRHRMPTRHGMPTEHRIPRDVRSHAAWYPSGHGILHGQDIKCLRCSTQRHHPSARKGVRETVTKPGVTHTHTHTHTRTHTHTHTYTRTRAHTHHTHLYRRCGRMRSVGWGHLAHVPAGGAELDVLHLTRRARRKWDGTVPCKQASGADEPSWVLVGTNQCY